MGHGLKLWEQRMRIMKSIMADWSQLPLDIIQRIAVRLDAVEDFVSFSAVCRSWRSFYLIKKWIPGPQMSWLMLSVDEKSNRRGFFSLYRDKVYELELPEASGRRCWGSSDGWLVKIGCDLEIQLLNAFTRVHIRLPAASTFQILFNTGIDWYQFIHKAIVIRKPSQSAPNGVEFLVMAIYGTFKQLAYTKPGYSSWINVEESFQHRYMDVAFVNDQIFALSASGTLLLIDINLQLQEIVQITSPPHQWACDRIYLVESVGDLLMVCQYFYFGHMIRPPPEPVKLEVFKFDFGDRKWTELKDLGNQALFIGDNISFSVCASKLMKCRGNSIYFIASKVKDWWRFDEHFVNGDSRVYYMADGSVEPFFFGADYPTYHSCPIWLAPILVYAGH